MNIVLDGRMIGEKMHGIARYAYNLIKGLLNIDQKNKYTVLIGKDFPDILSNNLERRALRSKWISISEQWELSKVLRELKPDVYHTPSFVAPIFNVSPIVMTIHDVNHMVFRNEYSVLHRLYYKFIVKPSAKKSAKILTGSKFSKKEINKYLDISIDKIKVIYNGCGEEFRPVEDFEELTRVRKKYGLPEAFILYVGNYKPHKNVSSLLKAYNKLTCEIPFVLSGKGNKELLGLTKRLRMEEKVIFIGEIQDSDLPAVYNCATLFVFPSFYEGFGLPPLEAMTCGCPVVVSNTSSLPEVCGNAVYYIDPYSVDSIAQGIYKVLIDGNLRKNLMQKGLERAKMFSWEKTANEVLKVFEEIRRE